VSVIGANGADVPSVVSLVREHRGRPDLPDLRVHVDDDMWRWSQVTCSSPAIGQFAYFRSGLAISDMVRELARWWCSPGPASVLDFACGYGRSLRFTIQDFGAGHVSGCEILSGAVSFVREVLDADVVQSGAEPEALDLDRRFDLIFVSSLFSHLPEVTFVRWLRWLHEHLSPTGLLVISVHDELLLPEGAALPASGIYFQPTTEVGALDPAQYGATVVNEDFVARAIHAVTGASVYRRLPTALCFEQDLYLVPADPRADLSTFLFRRGAQGSLDTCYYDDGVLTVRGWVATQDEGVEIDHVDVRIDGELVARGVPDIERPDVAAALHHRNLRSSLRSGFRTAVRLPDLEPSAVVVLTAVSSEGRADVVWSTELIEVCQDVVRPTPLPDARLLERALGVYRRAGIRGVLSAGVRRLRETARPPVAVHRSPP